MRNSDFILYHPSISVCSMTSRAFIIDGKLYKSHPNYLKSEAKAENLNFGHAPNLSKIVQSIEFMDTNGTLNVLNSSNSFQSDLDRKNTFAHYALQGLRETSNGLWVSAYLVLQRYRAGKKVCIWVRSLSFPVLLHDRVLAGLQSRLARLCHNSQLNRN